MSSENIETIVLGGGCFWCTEAVFQRVTGVQEVTSGYAGGTVENPTYDQVSQGTTGHAEVVQVKYDKHVVTLEKLLEIFFKIHDPTSLNKQGADEGPQYRSVVYYTTNQQRLAIENFVEAQQISYGSKRLVTEVAPLLTFYPAEKQHQDFFNRNRDYPYCQLVIEPKIDKVS